MHALRCVTSRGRLVSIMLAFAMAAIIVLQLSERSITLTYQRHMPDCIIIGVRKCGTRALLEFLSLHTRVSIAHDEVHFFDRKETYSRGPLWYLQQMPLAPPSHVTVEKTPAYFVTPDAPRRIRAMTADVKIIVIVREPTDRLVSDYAQFCDNRLTRNKTCPSFEELLLNPTTGQINPDYRPVDTSIYHRHLPRWLAEFPQSQLHIVDGDRLVTQPVAELALVQRFLGLEPDVGHKQLYFNHTRGFYCMRNATHSRCMGMSKGRKHPHVTMETLSKLRAYFRPYNLAFFNLTGRVFNWH